MITVLPLQVTVLEYSKITVCALGPQKSPILINSRKTCSQNCSASEKSHLPNSKITAQISRALSTSLRFDPNEFTKGMIDTNQSGLWIVSSCSSTQRTYRRNQKEGRRKKRGGGQSLESELPAVYHSHTNSSS